MNENQKIKFNDWSSRRGVWPRLTHEEIFITGWVAATSWQPIETAPKDQYLMLCLDGRDWAVGCWNRNLYDSQSHMGDWVNDDGTESTPFTLKPTHWMPLPQLPDKFENVSCSQCGHDFGQGEHGYSHCEDHSPKGQCADCKWAQEKEDRYDQVRCCCEESPNAWGDVEAADSCSSFLPNAESIHPESKP